jgi:hypothetical protein
VTLLWPTPAGHRLFASGDERKARIVAPKPLNLPNLRGVKSAFDKLHSEVEDHARDLVERRIPAVLAKARATLAENGAADAKLAGYVGAVNEIETFIDELGGSLDNGGPSSGGSREPPKTQG